MKEGLDEGVGGKPVDADGIGRRGQQVDIGQGYAYG